MDILFFISIELLLVIIDIMDNSNIWIEYVTMHVCICIYIRFQISANFFLFSFAVKYSFHDYRFYRELSTIQYNTNSEKTSWIVFSIPTRMHNKLEIRLENNIDYVKIKKFFRGKLTDRLDKVEWDNAM